MKQINNFSGTYIAQYISDDELNSIVSSPQKRGSVFLEN
ncbi:MAG: hypothetical protein KC516_03995 [Nanoarchaeota archaeon]|nr:hypothetical protein [Nanoarchaeota archaeon]